MTRRRQFTHDAGANSKAADPYANGDGLTYAERTCPVCDKLVKVRTYPRAIGGRDLLERYPVHNIGKLKVRCPLSRLTMRDGVAFLALQSNGEVINQ